MRNPIISGFIATLLFISLTFLQADARTTAKDGMAPCCKGMMEQCHQRCQKMMMGEQPQQVSMQQNLGPADANYDLRFINAMIEHHEGAINMAKDAAQKAQHPEIKQLSQRIMSDQGREIEQLKMWRQQWYGK